MSMQKQKQFGKEKGGTTIFVPQNSRIEEIERSLSLFYTLKEWAGNVNILLDLPNTSLLASNNEQAEKSNLIDSSSNNPQQNPSKSFTISINTSDKEVENLRYEKNENRLDLFLSLKKGEVQKEDIFLIKNSGVKKEGFPFLTAQELEKFTSLSGVYLKPSPKIRLLARVLSKIEFEEKKKIYSSVLSSDDFLSSAAKQKDLSFIVSELKTKTWKIPSLVLLWERHFSPSVIKGVFYAPEKDLAKKLLGVFDGMPKGNGLLFSTTETNLRTAKEKILNILSTQKTHED